VEDDRAARNAVNLILKAQGYEPVAVGTVAEAMNHLSHGPDWVLLDLMLPDGCGTTILRKIAAERLPTRVCVITGCGPEKVEEAKKLGPQCVLTKPLNVGRLITLLASDRHHAETGRAVEAR